MISPGDMSRKIRSVVSARKPCWRTSARTWNLLIKRFVFSAGFSKTCGSVSVKRTKSFPFVGMVRPRPSGTICAMVARRQRCRAGWSSGKVIAASHPLRAAKRPGVCAGRRIFNRNEPDQVRDKRERRTRRTRGPRWKAQLCSSKQGLCPWCELRHPAF